MANLDLRNWTWEDVRENYPDIYNAYGPGSRGYVETTRPTIYPQESLPPTDYSRAYGGRPTLPDPLSTAGTTIAGNLRNLPGSLDLAGQINAFNFAQSILPYIQNLPGYTGMMGQQSGIIADQLAGKVPADVMQQIALAAAERGVQTGIGYNAPNTNAAMLRALGLTSLGQQQQGLANLKQAISEIPLPGLYDPSQMMVTPDQAQRNAVWQAILDASPNPQLAAMAMEDALNRGISQGAGQVGGPVTGQLPSYTPTPLAPSTPTTAPSWSYPAMTVYPGTGTSPTPGYQGGWQWNPSTGQWNQGPTQTAQPETWADIYQWFDPSNMWGSIGAGAVSPGGMFYGSDLARNTLDFSLYDAAYDPTFGQGWGTEPLQTWTDPWATSTFAPSTGGTIYDLPTYTQDYTSSPESWDWGLPYTPEDYMTPATEYAEDYWPGYDWMSNEDYFGYWPEEDYYNYGNDTYAGWDDWSAWGNWF